MIEVDGSYGEGGGQMLRTALGLSIITNQPIHLFNIRANRPSPGLKPQHYTTISILKTISNASVKGLKENATEITFSPGKITEGTYHFNIGTAGSIVLIFQAIILGCLKTNDTIQIQVSGGTDVKWSPSWDYFSQVFLQVLHTMGIHVDCTLEKRGYYPKGGGSAILTLKPNERLSSLSWNKQMAVSEIHGLIHSANLPNHIAERMKHACLQTIGSSNIKGHISVDQTTSLSPGTGMTLWTKESNGCLGSIGLGERGVSAESIGKKTSEQLLSYLNTGCTVDPYLCDQIIPFLALAKQDSVVNTFVLSNHAKTNIWLIKKFYTTEPLFEITEKKGYYSLLVHGKNERLKQ